ncbi:MAG: peptidoglycan-associated lipoprotein Pal [Proteobacteria bacterium]|nr:peptidoglycan-associated lipoprotein Pal [Pseudomonadota bacterium]
MKVKSFGLILFVILISLSLSGCGCFQQQMKGETPAPGAPQAQLVEPGAKAAIPVETPASVVAAMKDVNFDFDKYNIRPGDAEILKQNADWFRANPGKKVRIEGYCDERGTTEYNLVLGQKRADSAKSYVGNLGVDTKLMETVSYGKEKPLDPGHNEAAWAKNRRAQFLPVQ